MALTEQNFTMYQGEDKLVTFVITDEDEAALNMTGGTLSWEASITSLDTTAQITKTPSLVNVDGTNDGARVTLVDADTQTLTPLIYYHELRLVDGSGNDSVLAEGEMTVKLSTTK